MFFNSLLVALAATVSQPTEHAALTQRCELILKGVATGDREALYSQVADKVKADGGAYFNKRIDSAIRLFARDYSKDTQFNLNKDETQIWQPKSASYKQEYPEAEKWYLVKFDAISGKKRFAAFCKFYLADNKWYHYHMLPFGF